MGYLDAQSYLYLVSRLSELIISGGENIYPTEVEQVLQAITGIKAAAVVGEPDAQWGAVPVAYVISDQEITLAQFKTSVHENWQNINDRNAFILSFFPANSKWKDCQTSFHDRRKRRFNQMKLPDELRQAYQKNARQFSWVFH